MRFFILGFSILYLCSAHADLPSLYTIHEKSMQTHLSKDSLYIEGKVSYTAPPGPESFGKISSLDFKNTLVFSRNGNYKIAIPRSAKGIFFFQEGYQEVVINLKEYTTFNYFKIDISGKENRAIIMVEKPVVYLYSDQAVTTNIYLKPKGDLTFTYPTYHKGWKVQTQKDGSIINLITQKTHPYLFWEASQSKANFRTKSGKIEGYGIKTDTVVQFLENQLFTMGLNARESTDFITYWAPRLQAKHYAIIQFMVNDDYRDFFGDIVSSTPLDYQLRIGMLFEVRDGLSGDQTIAPPKVKMGKRKGFSLIEWGGAEIKNTLPSL